MDKHKHYHMRLHLAFQDLLDCKDYAKVLLVKPKGDLGTEERIIFKALHTSLVVSYGRAFTRSDAEKYNKETLKKFKVFIEKIYNKLSQKEQEEHDFLIAERNKIFAHSNASSFNFRTHKLIDKISYIGNDVFYGYPDAKIKNLLKITDYFISELSKEKSKIETKYLQVFD